MLYNELVERWVSMHGQLRLRFGCRHGTIELPEVQGSVYTVTSPVDGAVVPDLTVCVVCWVEPCTHAFWPCGHRCVCSKCSSIWHVERKGHGACIVCQTVATECSQVYNVCWPRGLRQLGWARAAVICMYIWCVPAEGRVLIRCGGLLLRKLACTHMVYPMTPSCAIQ